MSRDYDSSDAKAWAERALSEQLHGPSLRAGHHPVGLIKAMRRGADALRVLGKLGLARHEPKDLNQG
jgi:hypothetical protein